MAVGAASEAGDSALSGGRQPQLGSVKTFSSLAVPARKRCVFLLACQRGTEVCHCQRERQAVAESCTDRRRALVECPTDCKTSGPGRSVEGSAYLQKASSTSHMQAEANAKASASTFEALHVLNLLRPKGKTLPVPV